MKIFFFKVLINTMLPTFFLKNALTIPQSYEYIIKYCERHPNYCEENKQDLCKKVLKISNFKYFPESIDYCSIYKQLAIEANKLTIPKGESYIAFKFSDGTYNTELISRMKRNPSSDFVRFANANRYYDITSINPSPSSLHAVFNRSRDNYSSLKNKSTIG